VNIVDVLNEIWTQILTVTAVFVTPDWGVIIGWLPVIVLLGLVMPFLTFVALGSLIYVARKPRTKVAFEEGPRVAEIGPGGEPVFPVGLPHCRRDGVIYPSGTTRCETCRDELRATLGNDGHLAEAVEYEPKMNVTPNSVAVKD